MEEEKTVDKDRDKKAECCPPSKKWHHHGHGAGAPGGFVLFAAFIGVAVYNVQQVTGFWPIVLAILKAMVWPAFLLHKVFTLLGM